MWTGIATALLAIGIAIFSNSLIVKDENKEPEKSEQIVPEDSP